MNTVDSQHVTATLVRELLEQLGVGPDAVDAGRRLHWEYEFKDRDGASYFVDPFSKQVSVRRRGDAGRTIYRREEGRFELAWRERVELERSDWDGLEPSPRGLHPEPQFPLGRIYVTLSAYEWVDYRLDRALSRHERGDRGELSEMDGEWRGCIVSSYEVPSPGDLTFYVRTSADRSKTVVSLWWDPEEEIDADEPWESFLECRRRPPGGVPAPMTDRAGPSLSPPPRGRWRRRPIRGARGSRSPPGPPR